MTLKEGQLALSAEGAAWRQVTGTFISDILVAQQHELWPRLKACRNPLCSVIFYDSSKNQARVWHSTRSAAASSTCAPLELAGANRPHSSTACGAPASVASAINRSAVTLRIPAASFLRTVETGDLPVNASYATERMLGILLRGPSQVPAGTSRSIAQVTGPAQAADLIDNLRTAGVILTYDPDQRTLRCQDYIAIGNDR